MNSKNILLEIISAVIFSFIVGLLFWAVGATYGGNNIVPNFIGLPGYEGAGAFAALFGFPIGGMLGSYIGKKLLKSSDQKTPYVVMIGLCVGIVLFLFFYRVQIF